MSRLTDRELIGDRAGCVDNNKNKCNDNCMYGLCKWIKECLIKLKSYEDLEEQGLLKRFECAIGDTVYRISKSRPIIYECTVQGIKQEFNTTSYFLHANINEDDYSIWVDNWFDRCQIGYEFYLTKEEAEKALERLEKVE